MIWLLNNDKWCKKSIEALSRLGISIYDEKGNVKSFYQILNEINNIWEKEI